MIKDGSNYLIKNGLIKIKKFLVKFLVICALIVVGIVIQVITKEVKVDNVFQEYYYSKVQSAPKLYTSTNFEGIEEADIMEDPSFREHLYGVGYNGSYEDEALKDDEEIYITFDQGKGRKELRISATLILRESEEEEVEQLNYRYVYSTEDRKLNIEKVTYESYYTEYDTEGEYSIYTNEPEEILYHVEEHDLNLADVEDYIDYFLYDKVLTDWFEHNEKSKFSMDNLGDVEIIDKNELTGNTSESGDDDAV